MTSFFANNGFHLCTGVKSPQAYKESRKAELKAADKMVANQKEILSYLNDQLTWAQEKQAY